MSECTAAIRPSAAIRYEVRLAVSGRPSMTARSGWQSRAGSRRRNCRRRCGCRWRRCATARCCRRVTPITEATACLERPTPAKQARLRCCARGVAAGKKTAHRPCAGGGQVECERFAGQPSLRLEGRRTLTSASAAEASSEQAPARAGHLASQSGSGSCRAPGRRMAARWMIVPRSGRGCQSRHVSRSDCRSTREAEAPARMRIGIDFEPAIRGGALCTAACSWSLRRCHPVPHDGVLPQ